MSALVEHQSGELFHPPFKIMGENEPLQIMQAVAVRPVDQPEVRGSGLVIVVFDILGFEFEPQILIPILQGRPPPNNRDSVTSNTTRATFPYMKQKERFDSIHGFIPDSRFNQQQSATYRAFHSDQNYFDWNSKAILKQVGTTTGNFGNGNGLQISNIYNNGSTGTRNVSSDSSSPSWVWQLLQGQSKNRGGLASCYVLGHCETENLSSTILFQNANSREVRNQCQNIECFTEQSSEPNSAISLLKLLLRFKSDAEILRRAQFQAIFQAILLTQVLIQGVIFQAIKKRLERDFKVREKSDLREKTSKKAIFSIEKENSNYSSTVQTTMAYQGDGDVYLNFGGWGVGGEGEGEGQGIMEDIDNYDLGDEELEWVEEEDEDMEEEEVEEEGNDLMAMEAEAMDVMAMLGDAYAAMNQAYLGGNVDEDHPRRVPGDGEPAVVEVSREDKEDEGRRQLFDEFANSSFANLPLCLDQLNPPLPEEEEPPPPPVNADAA